MKTRPRSLAIGCVGLCALVAAAAFGQSGPGFEIVRYSIDAGAGRSTAPGFEMVSVVGQPDAAGAQGGGLEWRGGFLVGVAPADRVFGDGFEAASAGPADAFQ